MEQIYRDEYRLVSQLARVRFATISQFSRLINIEERRAQCDKAKTSSPSSSSFYYSGNGELYWWG
ncbi:hypothetical protein PA598K_03191 [Paenibacillus sp. 598K]|nr:hypothetical protein PA598K_03191 [Paenibacillus sp. 598K]